MSKRTYLIEAVVDGVWHWFTGRVREGRLAGGSTWATTDEQAVRFTSRAKARAEQRRLGGTTFIRER